jgi:dihydroorotase
MTSYLIKGASLLGESSADIALHGGFFVEPEDLVGVSDIVTIDANGLVALPGLVDLHTHLRQPGMEQAETVLSGSQAAAMGGFTAVHAMANTDPVADTAAITDTVWNLGKKAGYVDVRPVGAVTKGLAGAQLSGIDAMAAGASQVRVFSDDGKCVHDSALMRQALRAVSARGGVLAQHAQDPRLTEGSVMNESALSSRLGLAGWPAVAEESIIARDVLLAQSVGARLHVCHLSTAGSLEVIAWAKKRGINVTAEVTPHHLLLTEDLVAGYDPVFKVNPPLRSKEDTEALRKGVASGLIDIIATDHAPHPSEAKDCAFPEAAFGMLGLETALGVALHALVEPGQLRVRDLARVMSQKPAEIGGLFGYPGISCSPISQHSPRHHLRV